MKGSKANTNIPQPTTSSANLLTDSTSEVVDSPSKSPFVPVPPAQHSQVGVTGSTSSTATFYICLSPGARGSQLEAHHSGSLDPGVSQRIQDSPCSGTLSMAIMCDKSPPSSGRTVDAWCNQELARERSL